MKLLAIIAVVALLIPLLHLAEPAMGCSDEHAVDNAGCTITHMVTPSTNTCASCGVSAASFVLPLLLLVGAFVFFDSEKRLFTTVEHSPPLPPPKI